MPGDELFSAGWWLRLFFRLAAVGLLLVLAGALLKVSFAILFGIALCATFPLVLFLVIVVRGAVLLLEKMRDATTGRE
ncbi:uncharacterized protein SOCE26_003960 [Sorangium cellulosum]|uniref:Transmembrane protein n=1 Tax=Sorangium cellulosum TaxID=56 RepID=A0A2L0EI98_SORCE|nr:hypothetical protein [Sorangium cellulosum]AUX39014.1 uncharacterized protein SOCE26_003960 [Sorangium cellulosum]